MRFSEFWKGYFRLTIILFVLAIPGLFFYLSFVNDEINEERIVVDTDKDFVVAVRAKRSIKTLIEFEKGMAVHGESFVKDSLHIRNGSRVLLIRYLNDSAIVKVGIYTPATKRYSFAVFLLPYHLGRP
jgi:hypothetical protein